MLDEQSSVPGAVPSRLLAAAGLPLVRGHFVMPPPPPDCLDRPRLRQALDEAVTRPLTVVRAPAGWGKTTLLACWAAARPERPPLVWIRIDPEVTPTVPDGPSVPLWPQLLHGLGRAGLIPAGPDLARPGAGAAHHLPDHGYRQLANLLADLPAPFVLVLDDAHLLRRRRDLDGLELLINEAGERARTIMVGRAVPVALHRLRVAGRVTEIDADALAFTRPEAADLLQAQGLPATDGLVDNLLHATEGWPAGLRLAAGTLARGAAARRGGSPPRTSVAFAPAPAEGRTTAGELDPSSASLAATPEIVEFLRAELLARQTPAVRRFLLRTSVLESMTGSLADAVVGEPHLAAPASAGTGAHLLAEFAQRSGFVVAHPDGSRFRYHRLLAALLRSDLTRDRTEDIDELHLRAALWFAAHRRPAEAVRHAAWAGDWWYASCLLVDGTGMVDALCGPALRLGPILATMPASWVSWAPECTLVAAVGHLHHGRVAKATRCLEAARAAIAASAVSRRRSLSTQADLVELRRAELVGAGEEMLGVARRLLRAGPESGTGGRRGPGRRVAAPVRADDPAFHAKQTDGPSERDADCLGEIVTALAWCGRGRAELWLGRAEPAVDALTEAVEAALLADARMIEISAAGALALAHALRGRLRLAESAAAVVFSGVGELGAGSGEPAPPAVATVGDFEMTMGSFAEAAGGGISTHGDAMMATYPGLAGAAEAHLAMAMVAIARADGGQVAGHLQAARTGLGPGCPPHLLDLLAVLDARSRCRRGRPDDVRAARRLLTGRGRPAGPPLCLSLWQAVEVDLLLAVGNAQAARQVLGRPADARRPDHVLALAAARANLACTDLDAADNAVAGLLRADGGGGGPLVAACALAAVVAARRDDHARATALLARALVLAEDEGLAAPFLDLGDELLAMLDAHPGLAAAHPEFVETLRAAAVAAPAAGVAAWRAGPGDRSGGVVATGAVAGVELPARHGADPHRMSPQTGSRVSGALVPAPAQPVPPARPAAAGGRLPWRAPGSTASASARAGAGGSSAVVGSPRSHIHSGGNANPPGPADWHRRPAPPAASRLAGPGGAGGPGPAANATRHDRRPGGGPAAGGRLSDRELAVLSYLPTMLTTAEIAAELYVSVNTVKTHLKSIYRKLDVPRRRDAVHRARELHLL